MATDVTPVAEQIVSRYSEIARAALAGRGTVDRDAEQAQCFGPVAYAAESDAPQDALLASLGCGNPIAVASLAPGEIVLDLGSGGGLDVLLSARRVAPDGIAYGLDASPDMLALARAHAESAGVTNATFIEGRIEAIPLPDGHVDVVVSNCVINLSGDKPGVLAEAHRVLKADGRLGVTDIVGDEDATGPARAEAEHRIGCAAGTLTESEYRHHLESAGFADISITRIRRLDGGLSSAIIQAVKPAVSDPAT